MLRIFKHYVDFPQILLAICDMAVLFATLNIAAAILQSHGYSGTADEYSRASVILTLLVAAGLASVGLYNREHFARMRHVVSRAIVALPLMLASILAMLAAYGWVVGGSPTIYYLLSALGLAAFFPLLLAVREIFIRVVDRIDAFRRRVVVIGSGARAAKIDALSRELEDRPFTVSGFVRLGSRPEPEEESIAERRHRPGRRDDFWIAPAELAGFCRLNAIDEVVVAPTERRGLPVEALLACKLRGIQVTEYASFWERESGQVDLDGVSPSWLVFSDGFLNSWGRRVSKRAFDVAVSLALLLLTLPITLPTALLVKLESRGPVFYRQERVGLRSRSFTILKFRSMRVDAEKDGPRWAAKNDSRVTRIGAFIRKVRIDEIPQVLNVLKGDMSFVGPRPERPIFVEALGRAIPYYHERHAAKPGITGWAQINYPYGATEEDARMKLAYDLYYIKNGSLFLDVIILLQTVKVLLWNDGAR